MRFRIHRAADEIGGNCIEVQADGKSLVLDLGQPLVADRQNPAFLPKLPALHTGSDPSFLGVVLSHPHQDHYGLLSCAHPSLPVFLGEGAARLLRAAAFFTRSSDIKQPVNTYRSQEPFTAGPFSITPLLVDHSAYDAHALVVEANGRKLLYSGDFRMHGRKSRQMKALMAKPPVGIDVLLMEGTVLGREDEDAPVSETALETGITNSLQTCRGLCLAYFSAQSIDRLVTFYRAARRAGRTLVVDLYTACILDALGRKSLPSAQTGALRVFLPKRQKLQVVRGKRFDLVEPYRGQRIYPDELARHPERWVVVFRSSMAPDFEAMDCLPGSKLMYSLWPGYLKRDGQALERWCKKHGVEFEIHHTSGHAYRKDLLHFVERIAPKRLVPIHTLHPQRYASLYPNVQIVPNGVWAEI